jgi:hypothetical protein
MVDPVYNTRSNGQLPVTGGIGSNCSVGDRGGNTDGMLWDDIKITVHSIVDWAEEIGFQVIRIIVYSLKIPRYRSCTRPVGRPIVPGKMDLL